MGLSSGIVPISKAILIETLPIEKASAVIALTGAVWYLGNFVGPFIGGFAYGYLVTFPYFFPSFIVAFLNMLALYVVTFWFKEPKN